MTFIVKHRGTPTPTTIADYECPVHGRFEATVERTPEGDAPDHIRCPMLNEPCGDCPNCTREQPCPWSYGMCGDRAEWRISAPLAKVRAIEAVKGGWSKPERRTYTDTRNLGEGQDLEDWKADRAKVWEAKRREDVVKFAKEHHERVIGGD